jgi:hypothetical protein
MQQRTDDSGWEVKPLPIIGQYNRQRFDQFCPEDAANFYVVTGKDTKKPFVMYPTFGRQHISFGGLNRLLFGQEPRSMFRTLNYWYSVVGSTVWRIDANFNQVDISIANPLQTIAGNVFFCQLVVNAETFVCLVDSQRVYVYQEVAGGFVTILDINVPFGKPLTDANYQAPGYIVAFGNRIAVSIANSSQFFLSIVNLGGNAFSNTAAFNIAGVTTFAQESGVIGQMGVLNNTLYIYCDFTTGVWANTPAIFSGTQLYFPWKKNTTYDWNVGIADPLSLDINFGRMAFLGQNSNGLLQVMSSMGGEPKPVNSQAIDVLFQDYANDPLTNSPFLEGNANGFLYQYENSVMYRLSAGPYHGSTILDDTEVANSLEYNFTTDTWHRCIEENGERCRVQKHVFFNNRHLVSVEGEGTVYELSGRFYTNESENPLQLDQQAIDAYIVNPMRYERITPIVFQDDYSELETDYVQIDFVFGQGATYFIPPPLWIPAIELFWSDDGGMTYSSADQLDFGRQGTYQWRMRWYQLGCSRNRCYKLVATSKYPIVVLGGTMKVRRVSGGAD